MATIGPDRRVTPHDRLFLPLFVGTLVLAWCALALFQLSPYGRYLNHDWTADGNIEATEQTKDASAVQERVAAAHALLSS